MVIAPTYLGNHNYAKYDEMKNILSEFLYKEDSITIDIDFLHTNELDVYMKDIAIPVLHDTKDIEEIDFQTKSKERIKKLIRIFKATMQVFGPVVQQDNFYIIKLYL